MRSVCLLAAGLVCGLGAGGALADGPVLAEGSCIGPARIGGTMVQTVNGGMLTVADVAGVGSNGGVAGECPNVFDTGSTNYDMSNGWTVSDGLVGLWGPANPFTPDSDIALCEIGYTGSHVTGPNEYTLWLLPDAGGCPDDTANAIMSWNVSGLGQFGSPVSETVVDASGICLEGGTTYWLAVTANGGGQTWGAANLSFSDFLTRCNYNYNGTWSSFGSGQAAVWRVTANDGCDGGPSLSLAGSCPGRITADVSGATPGGTVAYVFGVAQGSTTIPGGPCAGTQLGIQGGVRLVGTDSADGSGHSSLSGNAPAGACGHYLQALDLSTCTTSNVAQIN